MTERLIETGKGPRKGTGATVQRIPYPGHMARAVDARAFARDNDPDNVRVTG